LALVYRLWEILVISFWLSFIFIQIQRMRQIVFTVLTFFTAATLQAQKEDSIFIKRISDEILTNGKAYDNLRTLPTQVGSKL